MGAHLFSPLTIRGLTLRNRIAVSPMCQYSSDDGFASDWHLVHLGSRAIGGAGLVIAEATAVEDRGRISPGDLGIWKDQHIAPLARIAQFLREHGAAAGIQLAHAGRKASTRIPWEGGTAMAESDGGWQTLSPSAAAFKDGDPAPREMTREDIAAVVRAFTDAAARAVQAGFDVIELHGAHGYLIHEFLSPLINQRTDEYGGTFENRVRFAVEVTTAVRAAWPRDRPLFMRLSCSDWVEGGWDIEQSVELARTLGALGVDLIDCSSGGAVPNAVIAVAAGYQVPFADRIRAGAGIPTGAVGMITEPGQADAIIRNGHADLVLLAREMLRSPYWPMEAAQALNQNAPVPVQYVRAFHRPGGK
jgi:2,4-dienoyl-CoA reductase-like NADH-dependent reductase (Old Yellow Enzyme family)